MWSVDLYKETLQKIRNGELKEPREKRGIVGEVIWDFIELSNYIFPYLHFEIGVVNMEQVEVISPEEKVACNNIRISEVSLEQAKERLEEWHACLRLEKTYITSLLRSRTLTTEQKALHEKRRQRRGKFQSWLNNTSY